MAKWRRIFVAWIIWASLGYRIRLYRIRDSSFTEKLVRNLRWLMTGRKTWTEDSYWFHLENNTKYTLGYGFTTKHWFISAYAKGNPIDRLTYVPRNWVVL